MADIWDTLDYDDPCAVLAALRPELARLRAGQQVVEVQHGDTRTRFEKKDMKELAQWVSQLTLECQAAQTGVYRRHAIIAG